MSTAAMLLPSVQEAALASKLGEIGVAPDKKNLGVANLVKFNAYGLTTSSAKDTQAVPNIEEKIKNTKYFKFE